MLIAIGLFIASWTIWLIFANRKLFFQLTPTCYVAIILDLFFDLFTDDYPLWHFKELHPLHEILIHAMDSLGVYFVVTYLFLQTLPNKQRVFTIAKHIFYWTILSIIIEFSYLKTGLYYHGQGWNLGYSYIADWGLFIIFYLHHRIRQRYEHNARGDIYEL